MLNDDLRAGAASILPMLIGVIPFGIVAGVTPVAGGLGLWTGVGFSTVVFAGASQLAAIDVLSGGGSALVAALAACTINLRMLLYSASLAPYFAQETFGRRMVVAYLMTDQAYAVSITEWSREPHGTHASTADDHCAARVRRQRFAYYVGAGMTLWLSWQASTIAGALLGNAVPEAVPLEFAVPLVFMVLLIPTLTRPHAVVAAAVGGCVTVAALELHVGPLAIMIGALTGVAAGALVDSDDDPELPGADR